MAVYEIQSRDKRPNMAVIVLAALFFIIFASRWLASLVIEYSWWKELGQVSTWQKMLAYSFLPQIAATLIAFAIFWIVHARGVKFGGSRLGEHPLYARVSALALLVLAALVSAISLNAWTIVSFFGSHKSSLSGTAWRDPVFHNTLSFYFFDLPFYQQLLGLLMGIAVCSVVVFWLAARGWKVAQTAENWREQGIRLDLHDLRLTDGPEPLLLRISVAVVLLGMAASAYLGRYSYLQDDHGFMVGIDYVAQNIRIPLVWVAVLAFLAAAALVLFGRWKLAIAALVVSLLRLVIPPLVSAAYVKPNELALQRPYIDLHIKATRAAYGLDSRLQEIHFPAQLDGSIDLAKNRPLLDNVRLWDWRAFHDTVTQLQALRQYYVFADSDVDRYQIDGNLRQILLTPRELDITQLPDARGNWINGHFIYTHGYGLVMAEANKITSNGQPVFFIQDAPPKVKTSSLKLTRPELYFGEVVHEPVYVDTQQPEFNYPSGSENVQTKYAGTGGIPVGNFGMRLAVALANTDKNILLTNLLNQNSRMLIHRNVRERVATLAPFVEWDSDPYLVITNEGHLTWMIDGYTASQLHPFARRLRLRDSLSLNYIRNSVKATVDAYDGKTILYNFDQSDPILGAFQAIFPELFRPASEMPADIRSHARYPEILFRGQAEIYRTFHMQDPEAFYNREDLWDIARNVYGQNSQPEPLQPVYIVGTLPGSSKPEFLLLQAFTPRSKDNLIGTMVARCDGEHLGQMVVLQLSKQSLIYGPLQVEARIDSDQTIAKDLSLWNQQGSQVLRGQMLTLPIDNTFLYVEPIFLQSAQTKMPQLKKVVVARGNTLVYRDTYEQAISDLGSGTPASAGSTNVTAGQVTAPVSASAASSQATPTVPPEATLQSVREHLRRYRELSARGQWAEAGRELEALEKLTRQP